MILLKKFHVIIQYKKTIMCIIIYKIAKKFQSKELYFGVIDILYQ